MTNLSDKFPEILTYKSSSMKDKEETEKFKERYEAIVKAKNDYALVVKQQVEEKEVDKEEIFKEVNLNIKLAKFKGYSSSVDI